MAEPGFTGLVPVSTLMACRNAAAANDLRPFLNCVWLLPADKLIVACNGRFLMRIAPGKDVVRTWRNPGKLDAVAVAVSRKGVVPWLRKHRNPRPLVPGAVRGTIKLVADKAGRVVLRHANLATDRILATARARNDEVVTFPGPLQKGGAHLFPEPEANNFIEKVPAFALGADVLGPLAKAAADLCAAHDNAVVDLCAHQSNRSKPVVTMEIRSFEDMREGLIHEVRALALGM